MIEIYDKWRQKIEAALSGRLQLYRWPALASHLMVFLLGALCFSHMKSAEPPSPLRIEPGSAVIRLSNELKKQMMSEPTSESVDLILTAKDSEPCRMNLHSLQISRFENFAVIHVSGEDLIKTPELIKMLIRPTGVKLKKSDGSSQTQKCYNGPKVIYD